MAESKADQGNGDDVTKATHRTRGRRMVKALGAPCAAVDVGQFRYTAATPRAFPGSPGVRRHFCGDCGTPIAYTGGRWPTGATSQ